MRLLLDTHAFLWWITDGPRLRARDAIADFGNTLFLSAASAWEMAIKAGLGKLRVPSDLETFVREQHALNDILPLPITVGHALRVKSLPDYHRDPFDRLLVAQALAEGLAFLTADEWLSRYGVSIVW